MTRTAPVRERLALVAALAVLGACAQPPDQRVRVGGDAGRQLLASGGRLVQDYGAFQVVEASPAAIAALPAGEATPLDGRILLNAGAFDPLAMGLHAARTAALPEKGRALRLVQLAGPVRPEWREALAATGVRVVAYVPNDAYLVYGDAPALTRLAGLAGSAFVRWSGAYLGADKLDPSTRTVDTGTWSIQLVEDPEVNAETLAALALVAQGPPRRSAELGYVNLVVACAAADLPTLAARPDVVSIQPWSPPSRRDERQAMILSGHLSGGLPSGAGYLAWLAAKGFTQDQFTASGFGVDVSDSPVDNGTTAPNHFALYAGGDVAGQSRVAYARLEGTPNTGSVTQGCDGHGTLNAHIVAGYSARDGAPHADGAGYRYGVGVAPFVRIGSSVVFDDTTFTNPDYEDLQSRAWADGMRISANSWGVLNSGYTVDSQRHDALVRDAAPEGSALPLPGNQEMVIVFSAGNDGPIGNTVGSPGTAKNVITVGGSEGVQALGGADGCGFDDALASSALDLATFSSRGPTADGRRKPELVAPATHISGGVAQAADQRFDPPASPLGVALGCYAAAGVCGGAGSAYFPASQQWYTASSGTSHSTPAVAGAAALLRQWFLNRGLGAPSPAMTKAYLVNTARYLTGAGAGDTLPSNGQGMGLLDLGAAFDGAPRLLVDQDPAYLFTASGQAVSFEGWISDSTRPLRVSLAFTDAPGSTTGAAWSNNLDVAVTVGGTTYRGNVFSGASSIPGGPADARNTVESVFLPAGASGPFTITVTAANVVADGVPGNATVLDQDFALAASNACTTAAPAAPGGVTATATAPNQVEVSWSPGGATRYRIYRATTAGGPYALAGELAAPPFVDPAVSGLFTYHYVVRAADCAESPPSAEVSVLASGACTLPPAFAGAASAVTAGSATCGDTLTWAPATPACGGAVTYEVFRSLSSGFAPGIANRIATGVTGTSFADDLNLADDATYFYVVRATETSGAAITDRNLVEVSTVPRGAAAQEYLDDLDANRPADAPAYWTTITHAGQAGTLNLTSGCRWQSATSAWRFGAASAACGGGYPNNVQATLVLGGDGSTPGVGGVVIGTHGRLEFRHWYNFESRWDGAWLAYSTTGASGPWIAVPDAVTPGQPFITQGGYGETLVSNPSLRVWTATATPANGALAAVTVNLDALEGQRVWFAWRFFTDSSVQREGYYVDDVRLTSTAHCATIAPPPGPAVSFALAPPATVSAGTPADVAVTALDAVGQAATSYAGAAAVTSSDAQAILPAAVTFSAGVATASIALRSAGSQTLTVTDAETPAITGTGRVVVTAGAPAALAFAAPPASGTAGAVLAPGVAIRIEDAFGNLTGATDPVTLALGANPGGGALGGTLTRAAVAGVAPFADLVLQRAATGYTLTASATGLSGATSASFAVAPAADAALDFVQQASTTVAGDPFTPAPAVAIRDAFGNLTHSTAAVSLAVGGGSPGAALAGTATVAAVDGVATFPGLSVSLVGQGYRLAASSAGLAAVDGGGFDITPASADHLAFVQGPSDRVAGEAIAPAPSVAALDRFGNLATGFLGEVALGLAVNPTSTSLVGLTTATPVGGVATFPGVSLERAASGYALSATSGGLGAATSAAFQVSPGAVTQVLFAAEPGASVAGTPVAGPPVVHLADAYGNLQPAATDPVTLSLAANPGLDALTGTTTVVAVGGSASFPDLVLRKAAAGYALRAESGAATPATSAAFTVAPAAAARLSFTGLPASVDADAVTTVGLVAHDPFGNLATGHAGTARLAATDPQATLPGTATFDAGIAAGIPLRLHTPGPQTLTATDTLNPALAAEVVATVIARPAPPRAPSGGCGCGAGSPGELGLLLALGALFRAAAAPRRRGRD